MGRGTSNYYGVVVPLGQGEGTMSWVEALLTSAVVLAIMSLLCGALVFGTLFFMGWLGPGWGLAVTALVLLWIAIAGVIREG